MLHIERHTWLQVKLEKTDSAGQNFVQLNGDFTHF